MRRGKILLYTALITLTLFAGNILADNSGEFNIRVGLGYDFVSQEYFLNSYRYDTLLITDPITTTLLTKDYLDDKKGLIYIKFKPDTEKTDYFEVGWEQTPSIYRAVGRGKFGIQNEYDRLEAELNFELKERYSGTADAGENLSVLDGRLRYRKKLSNYAETNLKIFGENVNFDSTGELVYNYSRFGAQAGFSIFTKDFSSFYFSARVEKRNVPDSANIDYTMFRLNLGYFGSMPGGNISSEIALESKDYNYFDDRDDYFLATFYNNYRIDLSYSDFLKAIFDLDYFDYRSAEYLNSDYVLLKGGLLYGRNFDQFSFTLGPKMEALTLQSEFENDDDYIEFMAFAGLDFLQSAGIFWMFENQIGSRKYQRNPDYYSDFLFDRLSLIGTAKIIGNLSLDLLFSAEWEWHEIDSDDTRLYLLSTSLNYKF